MPSRRYSDTLPALVLAIFFILSSQDPVHARQIEIIRGTQRTFVEVPDDPPSNQIEVIRGQEKTVVPVTPQPMSAPATPASTNTSSVASPVSGGSQPQSPNTSSQSQPAASNSTSPSLATSTAMQPGNLGSSNKQSPSTGIISGSSIVEVTEVNFEQEIFSSNLPVFIQFYSPKSGPSRLQARLIEQSALQNAGKIKFVRINVDARPMLAQMIFNVKDGLTAMLKPVGSNAVMRANGYLDETNLPRFIDEGLKVKE